MNGFERRRQEKKNAIISAAFELFNTEGIDAVKVTDIAEKAGVSKVSIYNYFGSKQGLAREVLRDFMDRTLNESKKFMDSDLSFKEKFEISYNMKSGLTAGMNKEFLYDYCKILSTPEMQRFVNTYYETRTKPLIIALIEQGKREGDIDSDLSNEAVLTYLESFRAILSTPMEKPIDKKRLLDIQKLIFFGLRGK